MHRETGGQRSVEELESAVLGTLELYFEARLREVEQAPRKVGPAVAAYEQARRQLADAEEELEALLRRNREIRASTVDAAAGGSEATELETQLSELQLEVRQLNEAEKAAQRRKEEAQETLRRTELNFEGDLTLAADEVPAIVLSKVEQIDSFKARLDQRFAEGKTSVLGAGI
jgi:flagellar biosynthesis chaperone FliJ